jgi:hypothetical protein
LALTAAPAIGWAQDAPPAETTPPPPAAPADAPPPPAEEAPPPAAEPAPATAAASTEGTATYGAGSTGEAPAGEAPGTAAPAEEQASTPGWFRMDSDSLALQLWFGATHDLGGLQLATDIYVNSGFFGEFDIGPAFTLGDVAITPMVGIGFDWAQKRATTLIAPQLFTIWNSSDLPLYFESWIQFFFTSPFLDDESNLNTAYTRDFLLFKLSDDFALGPHFELTYNLSGQTVEEDPTTGETTTTDIDSGVGSMQIGGATMINYGANNTLLLYLGYETKEEARPDDRGLAGRFTFIKTW